MKKERNPHTPPSGATSPVPGEPIRYDSTAAGLQGVLITGQCSQRNLKGISSGIPYEQQVAGTIFELPDPKEDPAQTNLWEPPEGKKTAPDQ